MPKFYKAIVREPLVYNKEVLTGSWRSLWSLERDNLGERSIPTGPALVEGGSLTSLEEELSPTVIPRPFHSSCSLPAHQLPLKGWLRNQHLVSLVRKCQVLEL